MKKRINPLYTEQVEVSATETEHPIFKETAKYNSLDSVENCPICEKRMQVLSCNGIQSFVCREHRIALPTKDE